MRLWGGRDGSGRGHRVPRVYRGKWVTERPSVGAGTSTNNQILGTGNGP